MRISYHTHTVRCQHAQGSEDEYIETAIREGYSVIGFSDHGAWPFPNGYRSTLRMSVDEQPQYERDIRGKAQKYQGRIEIPLGYEYEYFPKYLSFLKETRDRVDYLMLGNHFLLDEPEGFPASSCESADNMARYADATIAGLETGLFAYLAHPDMYVYSHREWDKGAQTAAERLCQAARELHIPLEYNLYGVEKIEKGVPGLGYPCESFWLEAVKQGCDVIIGCDAHRPDMTNAKRFDTAKAHLEQLGAHIVMKL